ncbi:hypothetical protein AB0D54_23080 [Streptomyces xanthophaeus]|uniref:hypothetical protein n=1 Tax=Streptomyces xanthophaeus TaxID=67385 RepID=UPI00341D2B2F
MIGLFWITPDAVYVGSPPDAMGSCVRLSVDGLEAFDLDGASRMWRWEAVRSAVVEDVPVEGSGGLFASVVSAAVGAFHGEGPRAMRLRLETEDGTEEVTVHSAAARGYGTEEAALSQDLLARFVAGTADPRTVEEWGREHGLENTPKPRVREELLRTWVQA